MQNNFPHFGKKYKFVRVLTEKNCGLETKWSGYLLYDPETNKVAIRGEDGGHYWIDFSIYIYTMSWPLCRTGRWPSLNKYMTPFTKEELKAMDDDCVNFVEEKY
jgi:hypothetical protein